MPSSSPTPKAGSSSMNPVAESLTGWGTTRRGPAARTRSSTSSTKRRGSRSKTRSAGAPERASSSGWPTTPSSSPGTARRVPLTTAPPRSATREGRPSGRCWSSATSRSATAGRGGPPAPGRHRRVLRRRHHRQDPRRHHPQLEPGGRAAVRLHRRGGRRQAALPVCSRPTTPRRVARDHGSAQAAASASTISRRCGSARTAAGSTCR